MSFTANDILMPVTSHIAASLESEGEVRRGAAGGYVCYLAKGAPMNVSDSRPGFGATDAEALENACYWANQEPWVRVVPLSKAPLWARRLRGAR